MAMSMVGPTDTSAMGLGKQAARSGEIKSASTAQPLPMSDPCAMGSACSPSASGPLVSKLKAGFARGK